MSADSKYEKLVALAGLYGKAFFGHKTTRKERAILNHLWKKALGDK